MIDISHAITELRAPNWALPPLSSIPLVHLHSSQSRLKYPKTKLEVNRRGPVHDASGEPVILISVRGFASTRLKALPIPPSRRTDSVRRYITYLAPIFLDLIISTQRIFWRWVVYTYSGEGYSIEHFNKFQFPYSLRICLINGNPLQHYRRCYCFANEQKH